MRLSNFALNLRGAWMIHPEQASVMMPILNGILDGYIEMENDYPQSYKISCADYEFGDIIPAEAYKDKSIYVTHLVGNMIKHDTLCSPGTRSLGKELLQADEDPSIIGHIIITDSGGGAANSVPEMAEAITKCTKPVVAWVDGMAASAAIYAISYADKIIAHRDMDQIGCIGTMIELSGFSKYTRREDGYIRARIYADQSEEKNGGYEAALEGNAHIIKEETLNPLNEEFINAMKTNRPKVDDSHLKGKTFYAKNVIGTLIDQIGSLEDAMNAVVSLATEREIIKPIENMENLYPHLEQVPGMEGLVCSEDGTATLQACQLEAINEALSHRNDTEGASAEELSAAQTQIAELQAQIAERDSQIENLNTRNQELQDSLDAAIEANEDPTPGGINPKRDPAADAKIDFKGATNFAEAKASCEEFMKEFDHI